MKKLKRLTTLAQVSDTIVNDATCDTERVSGWSIFTKKLLPLQLLATWTRNEEVKSAELLHFMKKMDICYPAYVLIRGALFFGVIVTAILANWAVTVCALSAYAGMCVIMNNYVFPATQKEVVSRIESDLRKIILNFKLVDGDDVTTIKEKAAKFMFHLGKCYSEISANEPDKKHKKRQRICRYRRICISFGVCPTTHHEDHFAGEVARNMTIDEIVTVGSVIAITA